MTTQESSPNESPRQDPDRWIQTFTGRQFYPLDPRPEDLDIEDIAHALSMQCRFSGHCRKFYSIAQHSVLVSVACDDPHLGLLHDAAQAYLPDVASPLKDVYGLHNVTKSHLLGEILLWCGLTCIPHMPESVKTADRRMLATERRALMNHRGIPWPGLDGVESLEIALESWSPPIAKIRFLARFRALFRKANHRAGYRPRKWMLTPGGEEERSPDLKWKDPRELTHE